MTTEGTRPLTFRQAALCENAVNPRCRCRCHGASHGAARVARDAAREAFTALPEEDAHHLAPLPEKEWRFGEMGWSKYQRCPLDRHVMRRVKLGRRFEPHYYCPSCKTVLCLRKSELVRTAVAELVSQTGVDESGHVRRHVQASIVDPGPVELK